LIPLPPEFLSALAEQEEVLVTSRDGAEHGTVPVWFLITPPGVVFLFTYGFSIKARRWRRDPWVRLSIPGRSVEGMAHFVAAEEIEPEIEPLIVERWAMQGATTVEGLRRTLRDGVHVLIRVEGSPQ
jgi:hypothetical protein